MWLWRMKIPAQLKLMKPVGQFKATWQGSDATQWPTLEPMQVVPLVGQIWNWYKMHLLVAKFANNWWGIICWQHFLLANERRSKSDSSRLCCACVAICMVFTLGFHHLPMGVQHFLGDLAREEGESQGWKRYIGKDTTESRAVTWAQNSVQSNHRCIKVS